MIFPATKLPVLQNKVFNTREAAKSSLTGWVELSQNDQTGIVINSLFDPDLLSYDENYDNEQSNSNYFLKHLNDVYSILEPFIFSKNVIEVGCGKGTFLKMLKSKGIDIMGCDPTYEGDDPSIVKKFFSKNLELKGDVIILRHVLEHIKNPIDFLLEISEANGNRGIVYIEVPDFNWIIQNQVYFDIFYEHVNYFRQIDFIKIFNKILTSGTFFNDQYQYVLADLSSINLPPYENIEKISVSVTNSTLNFVVEKIRSCSNSLIYVWGAGSKGVISSIYLLEMGIEISGIIDINPMKQNKYVAITGLRVFSPDEFNSDNRSAIILVANSNYFDEIFNMIEIPNCEFINL